MNSLFEDLAPIEKPKHRNVFATLGASNHALDKRADADLYCTHPDAVINLLNLERFSPEIWEPCCGLGHISDTLEQYGNYHVRKSDIISRRSDIETLDFLSLNNVETWDGDIITNPPYSCANEMVEKAISIVGEGHKVAMWLRILFLESSSRKSLFDAAPPICVYVSSKRIPCAKNGDFVTNSNNAQGYAWYVWQKGYDGDTLLKWF